MKALFSSVIFVCLLSAANAQQIWPPGRYCGQVGTGYIGVEVLQPQGDGKLRVAIMGWLGTRQIIAI
jgi:hypothetical protein